MKRFKVIVISLCFVVFLAVNLFALDYSPIVSTDWLEKNLGNPKIVVIDIRKAEDYKKDHIPGSVNIFYNSWAIEKAGKKNEIPEADDLQDLITYAGINEDSYVVVVGSSSNLTELVNTTRVAWTLNYAGVEKVAVLDGGFEKWQKDGKVVTTEVKKSSPGNFKIKINEQIYADKEAVKKAIGKEVLLDTRLPEFFFGVSKLDFVVRAGHIASAKNLPTAWIYTKENTFKSKEDLELIAKGVIGEELDKSIIFYCDTGRLASGWWFVLSKVLGYKSVKLYDGSSEEWAKDTTLPMIKYSWH
jgi:thiosulfate/3-mercaptopyruvate sulfurtransferase